LARWNGTSWEPLSAGLGEHIDAVTALIVHHGELIVGGDFNRWLGANFDRIARWNGQEWLALGEGLNSPPAAFAEYDGGLGVGGGFTIVDGQVGARWAQWRCPPVVGDMNCDGDVDFGDINPFVQQLSNFNGWRATYPGCPPENGDINGDGVYGQDSFGDINPFVLLLTRSVI
jgi:hypothetical protein